MLNLITNQRNANWETMAFHLQCVGSLCSADLEKNAKKEHTVRQLMATLSQGSRESAIVSSHPWPPCHRAAERVQPSRILAYLPREHPQSGSQQCVAPSPEDFMIFSDLHENCTQVAHKHAGKILISHTHKTKINTMFLKRKEEHTLCW